MRIVVDRELCENHGQCALVAENVFRLDDDGILQYDSEPDDSEFDGVEEAADLCPVQAIIIQARS